MRIGDGKIKCRIVGAPSSFATFLFFYTANADGTVSVAKPVRLEFEKLADPGQASEPTLALSHDVAESFFQSVAEEMNDKGYKAPEQHTLEGTLKAQSAHLQDLRQLLKLKGGA